MRKQQAFHLDLTIRLFLTVSAICLCLAGAARADILGRLSPAGTTVPDPGTQQQELGNITFPAPYNVFEFPGTCVACHGGTIDQQAGHGGNWMGSSMASAARDPVHRAGGIIVERAIQARTGAGGGSNVCWRCHSPNGWYSGRFDPVLGGVADGSSMIHQITLSTDDEGVQCEHCHRTMGAVRMRGMVADPLLPGSFLPTPGIDPNDPVWNMMLGISDWPHAGNPYPLGPTAANPLGNATMQINDLMSYGGPYGGTVEEAFSDVLGFFNELGDVPAGTYTGQTYGIYPLGYYGPRPAPPAGFPRWNANGDEIVYTLGGGAALQMEMPVTPDLLWSAISPEHGTWVNNFVVSPEFCGSCHDVTVPILNHGMPEQRTYSEWKYSAYANPFALKPDGITPYFARCQDCHMKKLMHEYADNAAVSLNPDPLVSGWYPYSKDRNLGGGTTFHKFAGANRDLPMMMKVLYPEVDLELIGAPTGRDTRVFPGMQSSRDFAWDRAQRNTEIALRDAASAQIAAGPTFDPATGTWSVTVRVTNLTGHKIPSGYPDGRRMWINLVVSDAGGATVYESGHYDPATALLTNDAGSAVLTRALAPRIDAAANAVMIYEKRTGSANIDAAGNPDGTYAISPSLLNEQIVFDNRIPPAGFTYADYAANGAKFYTYAGPENAAVWSEDPNRYADATVLAPDGQYWDDVTYTFAAPPDALLSARAELNYQSHAREFMEHLAENDTSTLRPEGPPNIFDPNYPLTPTYLSDQVVAYWNSQPGLPGIGSIADITDLKGNPLRDNWGGVSFAAWLLTGKGEPFRMAEDDTTVAGPPAAPATVTAAAFDPFAIDVAWDAVPGAEGYIVWVRYGLSDLTASWDRLAVLFGANTTTFRNDGLNVAKSYSYKVQAFNAKGIGPDSAVIVQSTPTDLPLEPLNLQVIGVTDTTVTLSWLDQADNEIGFVVERQDVPADRVTPLPAFVEIARVPTPNNGGFGGVSFTDTGLLPGRTYNYRVASYNASGMSIWNAPGPVQATTLGLPPAPSALNAIVFSARQVDLTWSDNSGSELGFRVERATVVGGTPGPFAAVGTVGPDVAAFSDLTAMPATTYDYQIVAFNGLGDSGPSNVVRVTTPQDAPPAAPTNLNGTAVSTTQIDLTWTDNALNENGFTLERSDNGGAFVVIAAALPADTQTYSDMTVEPDFTYVYRVRAFNGGGPSAYATSAPIVTPGEPPQAPSLLTVIQTSPSFVRLGWTDHANNEQGFYIERSLNGVDGWTRIGTVGTNIVTFRDRDVARRTSYWYRVQAFNANGVSAYSDTALAVTR